MISCCVKTKSKGKKIILLLNIPNLSTLGVTKDDDKCKTVLNKLYDFTKVGIDIADQRVGKYMTSTNYV